MKKIFALLILSLLTSMSAFAKTSITFATDATYPPFEFMDNAGQMQGFDVDVIKAMCQKMQTNCIFVNQSWDSLIPSLQLGKFDAMFGALNITTEREKQVNFTNPYYKNTASFVAPKSARLTLDSKNLQGKTIGVLSGSTFLSYLQDIYKNTVKVNTYASEQTAFLDLTAGRIDAVMGDTPLIKSWLQKDNNNATYEIIGQPIHNETYFGKGYAIAVKKGNTPLTQQLNKALAEIQADGTLKKLNQKYFGDN